MKISKKLLVNIISESIEKQLSESPKLQKEVDDADAGNIFSESNISTQDLAKLLENAFNAELPEADTDFIIGYYNHCNYNDDKLCPYIYSRDEIKDDILNTNLSWSDIVRIIKSIDDYGILNKYWYYSPKNPYYLISFNSLSDSNNPIIPSRFASMIQDSVDPDETFSDDYKLAALIGL